MACPFVAQPPSPAGARSRTPPRAAGPGPSSTAARMRRPGLSRLTRARSSAAAAPLAGQPARILPASPASPHGPRPSPSPAGGLVLAADVQAPPAQRGGSSQSADAQRRAGAAGPPSSSGGGGGRPDGPDPDFFVNVGHAIRTLRSIYRDDVVFRDPRNCFRGLRNYKIIFWSLRFHGKLFFSALRVDIARIWQPDPREVRVRWTIVGHPRGPFSPSTVGVFDGVSTFKLDAKGLIYEHAVDNVILRPRGGVLQASPLFAGLGLADMGGGGGRVAVPGGAGGGGGGGGDPGFPCPNFEDGGAEETGGLTTAAAAVACGAGGATAPAAAGEAAAAPSHHPPADPTRLAAARAALAAAWAASSAASSLTGDEAMTLVLPTPGRGRGEGRPMAGAA